LKVNKRHVIIAGKIEKTAQNMKVVATYGNIELNSTHKIIKNGNIS